MVLLESLNLPMGSAAGDFDLKGLVFDGEEVKEGQYSLSSFVEAKVLVVIFMCNHCPYVQAVWDRLVDLDERFGANGVQFVGVNSNGANPEYVEDSFEKMGEYAREYGMRFPYLFDEEQGVARAYRAQCTPDIYVFDAERRLAYHGRIDDNWKESEAVEHEELAEAIEAVLNGEEVVDEQKPCMGCSIKWME